ncbi:MAG: hypothetical protein SOX25_06940 [Eubacteriales bacterium]|nr:hypothetical protein [Eubacteriales bacterium]
MKQEKSRKFRISAKKTGTRCGRQKIVSYLHGNVIGFIHAREGEAGQLANTGCSMFSALPSGYGRGDASGTIHKSSITFYGGRYDAAEAPGGQNADTKMADWQYETARQVSADYRHGVPLFADWQLLGHAEHLSRL